MGRETLQFIYNQWAKVMKKCIRLVLNGHNKQNKHHAEHSDFIFFHSEKLKFWMPYKQKKG